MLVGVVLYIENHFVSSEDEWTFYTFFSASGLIIVCHWLTAPDPVRTNLSDRSQPQQACARLCAGLLRSTSFRWSFAYREVHFSGEIAGQVRLKLVGHYVTLSVFRTKYEAVISFLHKLIEKSTVVENIDASEWSRFFFLTSGLVMIDLYDGHITVCVRFTLCSLPHIPLYRTCRYNCVVYWLKRPFTQVYKLRELR